MSCRGEDMPVRVYDVVWRNHEVNLVNHPVMVKVSNGSCSDVPMV